jgi:hypothetical protein
VGQEKKKKERMWLKGETGGAGMSVRVDDGSWFNEVSGMTLGLIR